ncbi:hypothetical protein C0989_000759, partial [Termitomyces sp. Mn162]
MVIVALAIFRQLSTLQDPGPLLSGDLTPASSCNDRKVLNIVWSCLTTIFACTWIAIHPNLPVNEEWPLIHRLKIFTTGLIAPELIVVLATRQWISSCCLASKYKDYGWTKTHGFFVIMGGFQICESDGRSPHTLKANEIEPYLKDHTITVSAEEILDKSKGDFLSKALVLLQVFWFILQVLARITQHLAITELELVTLGYAILNFIVYFCWWNKPFDVHYPIKFNKQPSSKSSKNSVPMPSTSSSSASSITPIHEGEINKSRVKITPERNPEPLEYDHNHLSLNQYTSPEHSPATESDAQNEFNTKSDSQLGLISPPSEQTPDALEIALIGRAKQTIGSFQVASLQTPGMKQPECADNNIVKYGKRLSSSTLNTPPFCGELGFSTGGQHLSNDNLTTSSAALLDAEEGTLHVYNNSAGAISIHGSKSFTLRPTCL